MTEHIALLLAPCPMLFALCALPYAHPPATRNQTPEDRKQMSEVRYSGLKSPCSSHHALCPLPYAHSPANRNQTPEDRKQMSEDRYSGLKSPCSSHHALCPMLIPRNPQLNTRRQKTDVRRQIFRTQVALLFAPCPMRSAPRLSPATHLNKIDHILRL
jgi:hypothetical protein